MRKSKKKHAVRDRVFSNEPHEANANVYASQRAPKLSVGDIIEVHGWVMLKGMDAGRYRVKKVDNFSYWFSRPKGTKVVVRHRIDSVDSLVRDSNQGDLNKIVVVSQYEPHGASNMPKKKHASGWYRVFSPSPHVDVEKKASNKDQAIAWANKLAEGHMGETFTVWNPNNEHIYQVSRSEDSWSVHAPHEDVLPEEMEGQEHLMMSRIRRPLGRDGSTKIPRVVVNGAVYKQAQLQELLQQYETAAGKLSKAVINANQALMGKKPDQALKALNKDAAEALKELIDTTDTIAGHIGLGGN